MMLAEKVNAFSYSRYFLVNPPAINGHDRTWPLSEQPPINGGFYLGDTGSAFYTAITYSPASSEDSDDAATIEDSQRPAPICQGDKFRSRSKSEGAVVGLKGVLKKETSSDSKVRRKVSFADANGLELASIRTFESVGHFDDIDDKDDLLHDDPPRPLNGLRLRPHTRGRFVPYFTLPSIDRNGSRRRVWSSLLDTTKVRLETFSAKTPWRISGTILVRNLSYHKRVFVRRTLDNWRTYEDFQATFTHCVEDLDADRFIFELQFGFKIASGTRMEMAVCYETPDHVSYWDNFEGNNYAFWFNDSYSL